MKWFMATGAVLVLGSAPAQCDPVPARHVHADVQMVTVPVEAGRSLVPKLKAQTSFAEAAQRIETMLASGEAELVGWPSVELRSQSKSNEGYSESIREINSPSRFTMLHFQMGWYFLPDPWTIATGFPWLEWPVEVTSTNAGATLAVSRGDEKHQPQLRISPRYQSLASFETPIGGRHEPDLRWVEGLPRLTRYRVEIATPEYDEPGRLLAVFVLKSPAPKLLLFILHLRVRSFTLVE